MPKEYKCHECKDTGFAEGYLGIGVDFCHCERGKAQKRILDRELNSEEKK